jgi:hypothetical protein
MRVRHFGLLANRHRGAKLAACRARLGAPLQPTAVATESACRSPDDTFGHIVGSANCPICGAGPMRIIATLAPTPGIPP